MKNMFSILSIFFLTIGCGEEETKQQENSIYGQWSLIKYEPGFSPTENFNNGEISWTFNSNNSLDVLITSDTEVSDRVPLNASGNYTYSTLDNQLMLDGNQSFKYDVTNNKLILSTYIGLEAGGTRITFTKGVE